MSAALPDVLRVRFQTAAGDFGRIFPLDTGFLTSNLVISINYRHSRWRWRSRVLTLTQPNGIAKFDQTNQQAKDVPSTDLDKPLIQQRKFCDPVGTSVGRSRAPGTISAISVSELKKCTAAPGFGPLDRIQAACRRLG
jgi:hypothetical protein